MIPERAEAHVNLRILPGESGASATARIEKIISRAVDGGVTVESVEGSIIEPVPSSPISQAEITWPDVIVAPYLMTGTTDSRWYRNLADAIYRFIPLEVSSRDMQGVHGFNESISLDA